MEDDGELSLARLALRITVAYLHSAGNRIANELLQWCDAEKYRCIIIPSVKVETDLYVWSASLKVRSGGINPIV